MAKLKPDAGRSTEIQAIGTVHSALISLDSSAQLRVLRYVADMLGITIGTHAEPPPRSHAEDHADDQAAAVTVSQQTATETDELEGISPVAVKWMRRAGLRPNDLQSLFSLGVDEIDLVAKKVPGSGNKDRMRSVLLLKGIAAYLGTGVARVTFEQLKEACLHYNAYDRSNFSAYLKSLAAEVSGTKEAGFTLTARGLTSATEMVKGLLPT